MEYPTRKLVVYSEPTIFNKEMAIGMFIAGPIGALIGGFIGKSRMNSEKQYGKTVGEPSAWNKDTALGALIGNALAGSIFLVGGMAAGFPALAMAITVPVIGGLIGGNLGKNKMENEYQYSFHQEKILAEQGKAPSQEVSVAPEMTQEQSKYRDMVKGQEHAEHHR